MPSNSFRLIIIISTFYLFALGGCGSGDSGGISPTPVPTPPPASTRATLSGIAASGAAFTDAVVNVFDSTGVAVGTSAPVGSNGIYTVTLSSSARPPYVLVGSRITSEGEVQSLVSVLESASSSTANITPVTNLIASRLSASGDPLKLAGDLAAGTAQVTSATVAAKVSEVRQILASILTATGTETVDPLKTAFSVDGTGYDRLLDSLSINIVPATASSSNIAIAVKQQLPDGTQPTSIRFVSSDASIAPLPPIASATLVAPGTSVLIADLLKNLSTCYALPRVERINTGGLGTPADITAPSCRTVFIGNEPAAYRSNGNTVGLNRSFNGIFTNGGTGATFSQGTYEFTQGNGDVVIGYKVRDAAGNETFDTLVTRRDADGKLKFIGNQYQFPGGVSSFHQLRHFITLDQSAFNYYSTGYSINVNDVKGGTGVGQSIFDRVVVTPPAGLPVTLRPSVGVSLLNLVKSDGVSGTNFIRLRSVFSNNATTGNISTIDSSLFFSSVQRTDAEISAFAYQAVWTFAYYLAGNTSTTPNATQQYKTRSRALTIEELRLKGLAELTGPALAALQTRPGQLVGSIQLPSDRPLEGVQYTVPTNALPVTQIRIFGRVNPQSGGLRFDDSVVVQSTARSASVPCTPASSADLHCGAAGGYAAGAYLNGLQLFARDSAGREYGSFYAAYRLTLP